MEGVLNHVGFTVTDLDAALALMTGPLGFHQLSRARRPAGMAERLTGVSGAEVEIAFVARDTLVVELLFYRAPHVAAPVPTPAHPGAAHLALNIPDIAATLAATAPFGLVPLGEVLTIPEGPNRGGKVAYVQHPCGLTLEFIQKLNVDRST